MQIKQTYSPSSGSAVRSCAHGGRRSLCRLLEIPRWTIPLRKTAAHLSKAVHFGSRVILRARLRKVKV